MALPAGILAVKRADADQAAKMVSAPYLEKDLAEISRKRLTKLGVPTRMVVDEVGGLTVYRLEIIGNRQEQELKRTRERLLRIGYVFELKTASPTPVNLAKAPAPAAIKPAPNPIAAAPAPVPAPALIKPAAPASLTPAVAAAPPEAGPAGGKQPPVLPPLESTPAMPQPKRVIPFPGRAVGDVLATAIQSDEAPRLAAETSLETKPSFKPTVRVTLEDERRDPEEVTARRVLPVEAPPAAMVKATPSDITSAPERTAPKPAPVSPEEENLACALARIASDLRRDGLNVASADGCAEPVGYLVAEYEDASEAKEMAKELESEDYKVILVNRDDGKVEVRVDDSLTGDGATLAGAPGRPLPSDLEASEKEAPLPKPELARPTERRLTPSFGDDSKLVLDTPKGLREEPKTETDLASLLTRKDAYDTAKLESVKTPTRHVDLPNEPPVATAWADDGGSAIREMYKTRRIVPEDLPEDRLPAFDAAPSGATALDPLVLRLPKEENSPLVADGANRDEPSKAATDDLMIRSRPAFVPSTRQADAPSGDNGLRRQPGELFDLLN